MSRNSDSCKEPFWYIIVYAWKTNFRNSPTAFAAANFPDSWVPSSVPAYSATAELDAYSCTLRIGLARAPCRRPFFYPWSGLGTSCSRPLWGAKSAGAILRRLCLPVGVNCVCHATELLPFWAKSKVSFSSVYYYVSKVLLVGIGVSRHYYSFYI